MKRLFWGIAIMCSVLIVSSAWSAEDLMIYFNYEDIADTTISDASGNGYDGSINGDVTLADGKFGKAAQFANGAFLDLHGQDIPAGETPREAFTICAWVKCENTGDHHAIFNARASDETWLIHPELRSNGQFRWLLRTDGGTTIFDIKAGTVEWDTWLHYAGTYDQNTGTATLYINGEVVMEAAGDAPVAQDWGMGARVGRNIDDARPFTGLMDEFSIWRIALNQDEIIDLMDNGPDSAVIASVITAVSPQDKMTTLWGKIKN